MICHGELPHAIMCGGGLKHGSENERNAALDFYYVCVHLDTQREANICVCINFQGVDRSKYMRGG